MATSKIKFIVTNGNIFNAIVGEDHVSSLLFDVTTSPAGGAIAATGEVHQIFSLKQAEDLGITAFNLNDDGTTVDEAGYENGVVHKHISDFFTLNSDGELYVGLADMSTDFTHLSKTQTVAQGRLRQQGLYTRQELFTEDPIEYPVNHTAAIQAIAKADEELNKPYSVILHANITTTSAGTTDVEFTKIGKANSGTNNKVTLNIGQSSSNFVTQMQANNTGVASIGSVGAAIGVTSNANVHECIGWLSKFNLAAADLVTTSFGYGDFANIGTDPLAVTPYEELTAAQLNTFDNNGYTFPMKHDGFDGTYLNFDTTLGSGDFNTLSRNRTMDKSRRIVRISLLPTLKQPLYVDPTNGNLSDGTINQFKALVHQGLTGMLTNGEISGFDITIDPAQNVLSTNTLKIKYRIVPVGTNKQIEIEIGLSGSVG